MRYNRRGYLRALRRVLAMYEGYLEKALAGADSGVLLSCNTDGTQPSTHIPAHQSPLLQLAYSPDGRQLATVGKTGEIKIWDEAGRLIRTFGDASVGMAKCIVFSPGGDLVAVAGDNPVSTLWNIASGEKIGVLSGRTKTVNSVAFSPDERCLATVSEDGCIKLWNLATRSELYTLASGLGQLTAVTFAGGDLVTAGPRISGQSQTCALHVWSAK